MATLKSLQSLFDRDFDRLKKEIEAYEDESMLWLLDGEIANSAGNLVLHLCGNLQHFFGAVILDNGYVRDRESEFGSKHIPKVELLLEVEKSRMAVQQAIGILTEEQLQEPYPLEVFGSEMTYAFFLIHLNGHLNYHLGQMNYHRRLVK